MSLIQWDSSLSVNIVLIDTQHKKLIQLINNLHDAMKERKGKEELGRIIDGLIEYTGYHFSAEEKYFDQFAYPGTDAHKMEHKNFVTKVTDFKKGFDEGKLLLSTDIMNFLKAWLVEHIQGSDMKYVQLFHEKGIK